MCVDVRPAEIRRGERTHMATSQSPNYLIGFFKDDAKTHTAFLSCVIVS